MLALLIFVSLIGICLGNHGVPHIPDYPPPDKCDKFLPTKNEIKWALHRQTPRPGWGYQARHAKDLRLFIVGGSNTHAWWMPYPLHMFIANHSVHPSWTGWFDKVSISGPHGAVPFIGFKYYGFERLEKSKWPNVIMFDFSVNMGDDIDVFSRTLDSVVRTIRYKYSLIGLPDPDFMFLELFCITYFADYKDAHPDPGIDVMNADYEDAYKSYLKGKVRGCRGCKEMRDFADFYGYPIVSFRDLAYPAFVRYFVNCTGTAPWLFMNDGTHLNAIGGRYLTETLFTPFFNDIMTPRVELPEDERTMYSGMDLRMYPPVLRPYQITSHTTWDGVMDNDMFSILKTKRSDMGSIIRKPAQWRRVEYDERDNEKWVYGAWDQHKSLEADFYVSQECNLVKNCRVGMYLLHSWNTSFIGSVSCDVLRNEKTLVKDKLINCSLVDGHPYPGRGLVYISFDGVYLAEGNHSLVCRKLDDKFTGIGGVVVESELLL